MFSFFFTLLSDIIHLIVYIILLVYLSRKSDSKWKNMCSVRLIDTFKTNQNNSFVQINSTDKTHFFSTDKTHFFRIHQDYIFFQRSSGQYFSRYRAVIFFFLIWISKQNAMTILALIATPTKNWHFVFEIGWEVYVESWIENPIQNRRVFIFWESPWKNDLYKIQNLRRRVHAQ